MVTNQRKISTVTKNSLSHEGLQVLKKNSMSTFRIIPSSPGAVILHLLVSSIPWYKYLTAALPARRTRFLAWEKKKNAMKGFRFILYPVHWVIESYMDTEGIQEVRRVHLYN